MEAGIGGGRLFYERTNLPIRVKGGRFEAECLIVETAGGPRQVAWSSIQLLCLGAIREELRNKTKMSGVRKMVRVLFFGEPREMQREGKEYREVYLLDLFVDGQPAALRIDSASVNYKRFLGRASFISDQNFRRLLTEIARRSPQCRLDLSAVAYLSRLKEQVERFPNVVEFEVEAQKNRANLISQIPQSEVHLEEDFPPGEELAEEEEEDAQE